MWWMGGNPFSMSADSKIYHRYALESLQFFIYILKKPEKDLICEFWSFMLEYLDSWEDSFDGTPILIGHIFIIHWNRNGIDSTYLHFCSICLEKDSKDNKLLF